MIFSRWGGNDDFSRILTTRLSGPLVLGLHAHSHVVCLAGKVAYFSNSPASDLPQAPSILKYFKHRGSTSGVRSRSLSCSRGSQHSLPLSDCLATKTPLPGTTEYTVDCFWSNKLFQYFSFSPITVLPCGLQSAFLCPLLLVTMVGDFIQWWFTILKTQSHTFAIMIALVQQQFEVPKLILIVISVVE